MKYAALPASIDKFFGTLLLCFVVSFADSNNEKGARLLVICHKGQLFMLVVQFAYKENKFISATNQDHPSLLVVIFIMGMVHSKMFRTE